MIDRADIEKFFYEYVAVGVPHDFIPDKLFFYFGYLKYVDETELKIETNNGYKIIPLSNVMDIHKTTRVTQ